MSSRHGELGVEPASEVAARAASVVHRIQKEVSVRRRFHTGEGQPFPAGPSAIILVSHGDALQLLQCVLSGRPLEQHRSLPPLENCGVRALRPPPDEERGEGAGAANGAGSGEEEEVQDGEEGLREAFRATGARVLRPAGEKEKCPEGRDNLR